MTLEERIELAKKYINDYCRDEFSEWEDGELVAGEDADFTNLESVPVLYTYVADEYEGEEAGDDLQVCINIIDCAFERWVNGDLVAVTGMDEEDFLHELKHLSWGKMEDRSSELWAD